MGSSAHGLRISRRVWCACAAVLVATRVTASAEPRIFDTEKLHIVVDGDWGHRLGPGYFPLRLDVTNLADARTLTLSEQSLRYETHGSRLGFQQSRLVIERTLTLARGARVQFTMPIPVSFESENLQLVILEGGKLIQSVGLGGTQSNVDADKAAVLIVAPRQTLAGRGTPEWATPTRMLPPGGPGAPGGKMPLIDFVLEPSRLPTSWLGYSALRGVMIGAAEWQALPDDQRTALRKWTACGGDLIVVDGEQAAAFVPGIALASDDGARSTVPYFLGHVHRITSAEVVRVGLDDLLTALTATRTASWRLPVNRAADWTLEPERGFRLAIPGIGDVHARGYLLLLLLFALLIGPVNYLYLQRRGLQPLLVLTTPLIATAFLVLLGVYVVVGEGFGVHVRAATLTVLDQERQEAVTRADVSMYSAGRTPGSGLRFSSDTAVIPLESDEQPDVHIDLADGQRFDRGLIRARTPLNFETVEWRKARERLTFSRDGSALKVANGLGGRIIQLFVRSPSGSFELRTPVASGGEGRLQTWVTPPLLMPAHHPLYPRFYEVLSGQPVNSYLALVERAPSWAPGIANAIEHDSTHVVLGILEHLP